MNRFALERHRAGKHDEAPEAEFVEFRTPYVKSKDAAAGPIEAVRNAFFEIHRRVLRELGDLRDDDLEKPAGFWDGLKPIRFRMHRFEAHMIQHTIQVDKTLEWIGRAPTEARRLVRVLYRDLAAVEMLTSDGLGEEERSEVAKTIADRAAEIATAP